MNAVNVVVLALQVVLVIVEDMEWMIVMGVVVDQRLEIGVVGVVVKHQDKNSVEGVVVVFERVSVVVVVR